MKINNNDIYNYNKKSSIDIGQSNLSDTDNSGNSSQSDERIEAAAFIKTLEIPEIIGLMENAEVSDSTRYSFVVSMVAWDNAMAMSDENKDKVDEVRSAGRKIRKKYKRYFLELHDKEEARLCESAKIAEDARVASEKANFALNEAADESNLIVERAKPDKLTAPAGSPTSTSTPVPRPTPGGPTTPSGPSIVVKRGQVAQPTASPSSSNPSANPLIIPSSLLPIISPCTLLPTASHSPAATPTAEPTKRPSAETPTTSPTAAPSTSRPAALPPETPSALPTPHPTTPEPRSQEQPTASPTIEELSLPPSETATPTPETPPIYAPASDKPTAPAPTPTSTTVPSDKEKKPADPTSAPAQATSAAVKTNQSPQQVEPASVTTSNPVAAEKNQSPPLHISVKQRVAAIELRSSTVTTRNQHPSQATVTSQNGESTKQPVKNLETTEELPVEQSHIKNTASSDSENKNLSSEDSSDITPIEQTASLHPMPTQNSCISRVQISPVINPPAASEQAETQSAAVKTPHSTVVREWRIMAPESEGTSSAGSEETSWILLPIETAEHQHVDAEIFADAIIEIAIRSSRAHRVKNAAAVVTSDVIDADLLVLAVYQQEERHIVVVSSSRMWDPGGSRPHITRQSLSDEQAARFLDDFKTPPIY